MWPRALPITLLSLTLLSACERVTDVGGRVIAAACDGACPTDAGMDAGAVPTRDAGPMRPGSRFGEAVDASAEQRFAMQLAGEWVGASMVIGSESSEDGFEVVLSPDASDATRGRFEIRCVTRRDCNPFGLPARGDESGTYSVEQVAFLDEPVGRPVAMGYFFWSRDFDVELPFSRMDLQDAGRVLLFDLGLAGGGFGSQGAVRSVVLARGRISMRDAGLADASLDAAALADSLGDAGAP